MKTTYKTFFKILTLVFCYAMLACGQTNSKPKITQTFDTSTTNKFDKIPKPVGFINDFEIIFTISEKKSLDSLVRAIEKETTIEIAVVTLDSTMTNKADFDSTTLFIAKKWGIGKKDKNNGILLGISKSLRTIRIQNGYGIEKIISNEQTKEIVDNIIIPQLKNGNFYEGARQGIIALYEKTK